MTTIYMVDSIESPATTGNPIPQAILQAPAVAAYNHGNSWPTYGPYAAARPDLVKAGRLVSITLTASASARCLDIESGGATISQAPGWFRTQADRRQGKPILYTFASQVSALISTMNQAGIARSEYLIWAAHFTYREHVCAPNVCGYPTADGCQYTDKVPGNCDGSVMFDYCFGPVIPPIPPLPEGFEMASVAMSADGDIVVVAESQPAGPGKTGEVIALRTTAAWNGKDGIPWHGEAGKTLHVWESLGTPKP